MDRGIVEDTYEHRRILRGAKLQWTILWDETGQPSGNILAISPEMSAHRAKITIEDRKDLLVDARDNNSDYLTGLDLILVDEVETMVPAWIIGATQTYRQLEASSDPDAAIKRKLVSYPHRCVAIKMDRMRCMLWCAGRSQDEGLCKTHLGSLLNKSGGSIERARARLFQAAPAAVDRLEQLLEAESEPVRLKAATEILDRVGIRGGVELDSHVTIDVRPAAQLINERLAKLALGQAPKPVIPDPEGDMEEAEVIEDDE